MLVILDQLYRKKTRQQLGYYYAGVVKEAADNFSMGEKEMDLWLRNECNKMEIIVFKTGEIVSVSGGFRDYNTKEMAEYIDRCIVFLAQQGYTVKTPDEYYDALAKQSTREPTNLFTERKPR